MLKAIARSASSSSEVITRLLFKLIFFSFYEAICVSFSETLLISVDKEYET